MDKNCQIIAGVDEVGRGPLVGSVVAAAVILDPADPINGLADSKKLSAKRREQLAVEIQAKALSYAIAEATPAEIDALNILQASLLAMQRAVAGLTVAPTLVLVDGNRAPELPYVTETVIKGDSLVPAISAASILAKVSRDAAMIELDKQYPQYGFAQHKGYPTAAHLAAIAEHGIIAGYRRTFKPVAALCRRDTAETTEK